MEILFEQYLELKKIQKMSKIENTKNEATNQTHRQVRRPEWVNGHVRFLNKISKQPKTSISVTKVTQMVTDVVSKELEDRRDNQLKLRYHIRQLRIAHFNMKKKQCV